MSDRGSRAFAVVQEEMEKDPEWAWSWHCNLAMLLQDAGVEHTEANARAASFMKTAFEVETLGRAIAEGHGGLPGRPWEPKVVPYDAEPSPAPPSGSVVSLAEKLEDSRMWSMDQMLEEALREIRSGERLATKAVVVWLYDKVIPADESPTNQDMKAFAVGFTQAGLHSSEMVVLFEAAKCLCLEDLGYTVTKYPG